MKHITKNNNNGTRSEDSNYNELEVRLISFAELQGRQNGEENKPMTESEYKVVFVNTIRSEIQKEIDENQRINLPISGMVVVNNLQKETELKTKSLNASKFESEHQLLGIGEKKKKFSFINMPDKKMIKWSYIVAFLISLIEGLFACESFRLNGYNILTSITGAVGVAVIVGFGTHMAASFIKKIVNGISRFIVYTLTLLSAFILFIALGNLRAAGINNINLNSLNQLTENTNTVTASGFYLAIMSFIFFVFGLVLAVKYSKSIAEKETIKLLDDVIRDETNYQKNIANADAEIKTITKELAVESAIALQNYETALAKENKLIALSYVVTNKYVTTNIRSRTDGFLPLFFAEPTPIRFNTFFDNLTK